MKSVKELLSEGKAASYSTPAIPSDRKVKAPPVILFRRTAIRTFPDNHIVALYYSPQLDKYVSIPFGPEGKALTIDLSEEAWSQIKRKDLKTWEGVEKKKNVETNDPSKDQPDDISFDWKKVRRKKKIDENQLNELGPVIPALIAAARVAAPAIGRGLATVGRNSSVVARLQRSRLSAIGRSALDKARKIFGIRRSASQRARDLAKRRRAADIGIGAAAGGAIAASGGGGNSTEFKPNSPHEFSDERLSRLTRISNPVNVWTDPGKVNNPVTNYRQKQNMNYVWNTQPTRMAVQEHFKTIERIIQTNKTEILGESGISVTPRIAKKLVNLHNSLNTENKQNFEKMISESADSLRKVINFSLRI